MLSGSNETGSDSLGNTVGDMVQLQEFVIFNVQRKITECAETSDRRVTRVYITGQRLHKHMDKKLRKSAGELKMGTRCWKNEEINKGI